MYLLIALLAIGGAIFILFSDEFAALAKKIWKIRGVKLFLPLVVLSLLYLDFFHIVSAVFFGASGLIQSALLTVSNFIYSHKISLMMVQALFLFLATTLPVMLVQKVYRKNYYVAFPHTAILSAMLFVLMFFLVLVY